MERGQQTNKKTYLSGQREHHHPLRFKLNPMHSPLCTQIPLLLNTLYNEHTHCDVHALFYGLLF